MKINSDQILLRFSILICLICLNLSQKLEVDLLLEYPYTCGTWFNRGKNTCNFIIKKLEDNNISVRSSIKAHHQGEFTEGYNDEFNIYMNKESRKILIATSDKSSPYFQEGLKYFAFTFYRIDESNGEKNYLEEFPQKNELLDYVLKRTLQMLKTNNLK